MKWNKKKLLLLIFLLKAILEPLSKLLITTHKTNYLFYYLYQINLAHFTFKLSLLVSVGAYLPFLIPRILSAFQTLALAAQESLTSTSLRETKKPSAFFQFLQFHTLSCQLNHIPGPDNLS